MAHLEVQGLTKRYGETLAVNGVSLKVLNGTFSVILGPSGSGKTTLLRCVAGFEKPDAGTVMIGGAAVTDLPPRERDLAMVFQTSALFPLMTVRDNIGFPLKVRNTPKAETDSRVKEVAELLVISHLLDKKPGQLSGGEQQRVALGRAIVRRPNALLMDEPLTGLDVLLRAQLRTELKRIRRETQMTAIYVTHDQAEAMGLADVIVIMNAGSVMQSGEPLDVYSRPRSAFVAGFVGNPPTNILRGTFSGVERGGEVRVEDAVVPLDQPTAEAVEKALGGESDLLVGVRPEDVQFSRERASAADLEIVVESVEPLGSSTVVTSLVGGDVFRLVLPPEMQAGPGTHLWLRWSPKKMHFFRKSGDLVL